MINVIFFATPEIAVKSLEHFINSDKFNVQAVVTQPDRPKGRGHKLTPSPVKVCAEEHNIPVFQPASIRKEFDIQEKLKEFNTDFFVTFAFGQILSQDVLDIPKFETINLHASLLPRYRGANPIQRAIINGDKKTGVCTMITELGLDCGDVCKRQEIEITEEMNCNDLAEIISEISGELLEQTLIGLYNHELEPEKQAEDGVCMANKVAKKETKIDWNKDAECIHNLVRGIYNSPCAFFQYQDRIIKVLETCVLDKSLSVGEFCPTKSGLEVGCGNKCLLLKKVKPEGKGVMSAADWFRGLK